MKESLQGESAGKSSAEGSHPPVIEETLLDEADVADAAAFEFEDVAPRSGILGTIGRIVRRKRFFVVVGLLVLAVVGLALKEKGYLAPDAVFGFLDAHPLLAPLAFLALFVVMTLLLLPTLPLNLGAGFLWGPYWGGLYTVIGASIGASLAFLVSRYLAASFVDRHFRHRTWLWLLEQVRQQNWKIVAFTRINPIFPTAPRLPGLCDPAPHQLLSAFGLSLRTER